jgi:RimJ/RimL family protein N-acetyltransferase
VRPDLASLYARWTNQLEVRRGLDFLGIASPHSQDKWVEENLERSAKREPEGVEFTIYDRGDSTPVGTAGLFGIEHAHGSAKFGIAIGERRGAHRPRAHGRRAGGLRRVGAALSARWRRS